MTCPYCKKPLTKMVQLNYFYCKESNHYYEYSYNGERLILPPLNISLFYSRNLKSTTVYNCLTLPYFTESIIYECNINLIEKLDSNIELSKNPINYFNKLNIFS